MDSVSAAATLIFEVPSGILADKTSRKGLVILGKSLILFNLITLLVFENYFFFAFSAFVSGIGQAIVSGTEEAMVYDWFKLESNTAEYKMYMGEVNRISFILTAVMTLFSSVIFEINNNIPMMISVLFQVLSIVCVTQVVENKIKNTQEKINIVHGNIFKQLGILKKFLGNKTLISLTVTSIVMLEVISNVNYTTQTYIPSLGIDIKYLGLILAILNLISACGAKFTKYVKVNTILWGSIYTLILLLLSCDNVFFVFLALGVSRFINGFIWSVLSYEVNQQIDTNERASMLSVRMMAMSIVPLFIDPLLGIVYDKNGIAFGYLLMAGVLGVMVIYLLIKCFVKEVVRCMNNNKK